MWTRIQRLLAALAITTGLHGSVLLAHPTAAPSFDQQDDGPGYCWDEYVKEAVAVFDEWWDCHDNVAWYDLIGRVTCDLIYEARAIGAAAWWAKCVGLPRNAEA